MGRGRTLRNHLVYLKANRAGPTRVRCRSPWGDRRSWRRLNASAATG